MKIKSSDIKLLCSVGLVLVAVFVYYYCSTSLSDKTSQYKAENATLQTEVDYLQDLMNHKEQYIADTEAMQTEITNITGQFPSDVRVEDQIMYANNLELKNALIVENVTMPGKELVSVSAPATTTSTVDQVVDDSAAIDDTATATDDTAVQVSATSLASTIVLYRSPTTLTFKSTYKSFKDIISTINEDTKDKKSIESLTLAYDTETGNLAGTLQVSMYSIDGTDTEYSEPNVSGVKSGLTNIFGTTEDVNSLRTTTTGAATTDENVQDNAESDATKEE